MKKLNLLFVGLIFITASGVLSSGTAVKTGDEIQRQSKGVLDFQKNTLSNFDFIYSNFGIFGLDQELNSGSSIWPRGSMNQYIYGAGFWFSAQKEKPDNSGFGKYVELTYNPNNGRSWFVPGRIEEGDTLFESLRNKYRLYFSTDFEQYSGVPLVETDGPNWPLWIDDTNGRYQYGTYRHSYVNDTNQRNRGIYPYGPMFVSDEDIVSTFKDTDLRQFDGGAAYRQSLGYPLGLQAESRIYSWGEGDMNDVIIHSFLVTNMSDDTLRNCWFAGVYDVDIAFGPQVMTGAVNDRLRYVSEDTSLNLCIGWTETTMGEAGKNFGYIGITTLETPAVDVDGFIRNDRLIFEPSEQLGLTTFRNWRIDEDISEDNSRYDFMASGIRDGDNGPADRRMLIATGPFNMLPGDIARVAFGIAFALPALYADADGSYGDIAGLTMLKNGGNNNISSFGNGSLIDKIHLAKEKYYQVLNPSGINDENYPENDFLLYPNPAGDFINIHSRDMNNSTLRYDIYDIQGNLIISGNCSNSVDISVLSSGCYYLKLGNKMLHFTKI